MCITWIFRLVSNRNSIFPLWIIAFLYRHTIVGLTLSLFFFFVFVFALKSKSWATSRSIKCTVYQFFEASRVSLFVHRYSRSGENWWWCLLLKVSCSSRNYNRSSEEMEDTSTIWNGTNRGDGNFSRLRRKVVRRKGVNKIHQIFSLAAKARWTVMSTLSSRLRINWA